MKKITLLLMLLWVGWSFAQASLYTFTASTAPYVETSGNATPVPAVNADSGISLTLPIGFNFYYEDVLRTNFYMSSNGFISFGSNPSTLTTNSLSDANATSRPIIAPLWDDLDGGDVATAGAYYEVTGTSPNRVLTVEWRNWQWNYQATSAVISFQVKLHETTNVISFAYRQEAGAFGGTPSASIGINASTGSGAGSYNNVLSLAAPEASSSTIMNNIAAKPATNTLFTFTPPPPCSGTPGASTVNIANMPLCLGANASPIAVSMVTPVSGLTYQWEESTDDFATTVNAIGGTGATTAIYTPPAYNGTPKKYRAKITCTASGLFSYSPVVTVGNAAAPSIQASNITFTNKTYTGMTINWTAGSGGRRYVIVNTVNEFSDPEDNVAPGTAATAYAGGEQIVYDGTGTSVSISGLTCNTTYYVRVYEYLRCGTTPNFEYFYNTDTNASNPVAEVSAAPLVAALPVFNDFTDFTGTNLGMVFPGWSEGTGATAPTGTTSAWLNSTYMPVPTAKVNLFAASKRDWMITPAVNVTESSILSFKYAETEYNNAGPDGSGGMAASDDYVAIMVSEDGCGTTWTELHRFEASSDLPSDLTYFEISLDDYIGSTIQLAFMASEGTDNDDADYDFHISNVKIRTTPTCYEPVNLTMSQITSSGATVSFEQLQAAPALGYEYVITSTSTYPADSVNPMGTIPGASDSAVIGGLEANTKYYLWIRGKCSESDLSLWSDSAVFTTKCEDVETFTENFDALSTGSNVLPACWKRMGNSSSAYVTTGGIAPGSAPNRFYMYATGGTNATQAFAMMPPVSNLQAGTHRLKFKAYATTAGGTLDVGYFTDDSDITTWELIEEVSLPGTAATTAQELTVEPGELPEGVKSLVFRNGGFGTSGLTVYIDDIAWEPIPQCPDVPEFALAEVTTTSATFTWEYGGGESAWDLIWAPSSVTDPNDESIANNISTVNETNGTIEGLTPQTAYKVWVRSNCGSTNGIWIGPIPFTTQCEPASVPYLIDFENVTVPAIPACTSRINMGTGNNWTTASPNNYGFNSKVLYYAYNSSNAANAWFFTQGITLEAGQSYDLSFLYGSNSANYGEDLRVSIGTSPIPDNMYQEIYLNENINNTTALPALESFSVEEDGVYYIGFNVFSPANYYYLYIDNIKVVETPTCLPVSGLSLASVSDDDVEFQWEPSETEPSIGYEYAYSLTNTIPATLDATNSGMVAPAENSAVISGLTPNTTYYVWVRTACSDSDRSEWTNSLSFTTQCEAVDLPYLQNFESAVTPALPACTSRINMGTGNNWTTTSPSNYGFTSKVLYYVYSTTSAANAWFFTRGLNLVAGQSYDLSFLYGSNSTGYNEKLRVSIGTSPTPDMDQELWLNESINNNLALPAETSFTVDTDGVYYIGFHVFSAVNQFYLYVDDINVMITPTCVKPTNLKVTGLDSNEAEISWDESETTPEVGYEYAFATSNTIPATLDATNSGIVGPAVNSATITGLTPNTTYWVWVRTVCSDSDSSEWSSVRSFTTQCTAVTSFYENFDSYSTGANVLPTCWSRTGNVTTAYVTTGGATPGTAPNRFYMNATGSGTTPTQVFAIMPAVSNLQAGTHQLKFKAYATAANRYLQVGYFENITDINSFVEIQNILLPGTTAATAGTITVFPENVPEGVKNLVFRNGGVAGGATTLYIDDVSWEVAPLCPDTMGVIMTGSTETSVSLAWNEVGTAAGYQIIYGPTTVTDPNDATIQDNITTATGAEHTIEGLTSQTSYRFWVRATCGTEFGAWSAPVTVTTLCGATDTPYVQNFDSATVGSIPDCTSTFNAGSGNNWTVQSPNAYGFTSKALRYQWNAANAANAWFFTQGINLTAGVTYSIGYRYGGGSTSYIEKLKVMFGTGATPNAMTEELADYPSINTATANTQEPIEFTVAETGVYYFGFHAYSAADQFYLLLDDIVIDSTLGTDVPQAAGLSVYPNPVKDYLTVALDQSITKVGIYNLLGQEVITKEMNANSGQVDMSHLAAGTYLVKVYANSEVKTIKVIKQ